MHIALVGAGIVGVTTALELAADGHAVTVFEQHGAVAEAASFATAGLLGPACVRPWLAPRMPRQLARLLLQRLRAPFSRADLSWLRRWLRASRPGGETDRRAELMHQFGAYSRQRLQAVSAHLQYTFEQSAGLLLLLRDEAEWPLAQAEAAALREAGHTVHEVDADAVRRIEPALNPHSPLAGGLHLPDEGVANCRQFAVIVRDAAEQLGARFLFNTRVQKISPDPQPTLHLAGQDEALRFDAVVLCAGLSASELLHPLGLNLPLHAVYGYSVSAPMHEPLNAPRSGIIDQRTRTSITQLGQRVRIAGAAEVGGQPGEINAAAIEALYKTLREWFPAAIHSQAQTLVWKGARPTLPDGLPALGASGVPGIWLNLGHADHGWALACGSARTLADLLAGEPPAPELHGLSAARFLQAG